MTDALYRSGRVVRLGCSLAFILFGAACGGDVPLQGRVPADRSSPLVEEVLSTPVGGDFDGLAYAHRAFERMGIAPEADLALSAYERAVLTAWMDASPQAPRDEGQTVRDAIERELQLGRSSLETLRRQAITAAKQRRIPCGLTRHSPSRAALSRSSAALPQADGSPY